MPKDLEVRLTQPSQLEDLIIPSGDYRSNSVETKGARGFGVQVGPSWDAANIGFFLVFNDVVVPLYDSEGNVIQITGISTTIQRIYASPPDAIIAGAAPRIMLVSLSTTTPGEALIQTAERQLRLFRIR